MPDPRLQQLEERITWLQRHVTEQDKVMLETTEELKRLRAELKAVQERLAGLDSEPGLRAAEERPPHY